MAVKKKKQEKAEVPEKAGGAEADQKAPQEPEKQRPVINVVEVVEDTNAVSPTVEELPKAPSSVITPTDEPKLSEVPAVVKEAAQSEPPKEEKPELPKWKQEPYAGVVASPPSTPTEEEKRKEVVGELYDEKKDSPVMPEITMHTSSKSKMVVIILGIIIAVVAVGGGIFAVQNNLVSLPASKPAPTPTPTKAPTAQITPTPTTAVSEVDRGEVSIQILNGGGTPGAAGKMKTFLEDKGYTISTSGNAKEYTYEETEILVKKSKQEYLEVLKTDISEKYTVGTASATLPESSSSDVLVTVGKE